MSNLQKYKRVRDRLINIESQQAKLTKTAEEIKNKCSHDIGVVYLEQAYDCETECLGYDRIGECFICGSKFKNYEINSSMINLREILVNVDNDFHCAVRAHNKFVDLLKSGQELSKEEIKQILINDVTDYEIGLNGVTKKKI